MRYLVTHQLFGDQHGAVRISARRLHKRGRRRLTLRSDWVATPNAKLTAPGGITMKWTKPEAEVVAVTMEVTAYVATL